MCNGISSRFTTPATTVLLVISTILCLSTTTVTSAPTTMTSARWLAPCSGTKDVLDGVTGTPSTSNALGADGLTFRKILTNMKRLKKRVRELKNIYIRHRFRDDSMADDLDMSGLRLVGMPDAQSPTINNIDRTDMAGILRDAFENLGRAAVFVSQARIGETLAAHDEPMSLERHWQTIEDHPEFGVYWLLCALHRLHQPQPADVVNAIGNLRVGEVDRNALRHTRDYLVLRDLERVLERLQIQFARIGQRRMMRRS